MLCTRLTVTCVYQTRLVLLGLILVLFVIPASAETVSFTVDPSMRGITFSGRDVDFFSQDLNGIVLNGQSLSLNVMLDDEVLARMLLHDRIGVSLLLFTTATTFPGTAGPSTGYLLDENGSQIGGFQNVGSTQSSGGAFGLPMSLITTQTMGTHAVDISGAHYNTIFPSSGYTVTNARLRFTVAGASQLTFGTAQQLPEPSSLVLLLTGCGAFLLNRRRTSRHQT
jgi:hypothetical protein